MAEILFLQRGNHRAVDDFERFLDGQLVLFKRMEHVNVPAVDKHGKPMLTADGKPIYANANQEVQYALQGGRREYKIMGYAIPDNKVNEFLNGLNIGDGEVTPWQAKVAVNALRKMMGAEPIPKKKDRGDQQRIIPREGVAIYMIGVKKDATATWIDPLTGKEFTQENI